MKYWVLIVCLLLGSFATAQTASPASLTAEGIALYEAGQFETALQKFEQAVNLDAEYAPAYFWLAQTYYFSDIDDYLQALANYDRAVTLDPGFAEAYAYYANAVRFVEKDFAKALRLVNQAVFLDPSLGVAYFIRGRIYYDQAFEIDPGRWDLVIEDMSRALELGAAQFVALLYDYRAYAYNETGQYALAIEDLNLALELQPTNPTLYNNRGYSHARLEDWDQALRDYAQARQLDKSNQTTLRNGNAILDRYYASSALELGLAGWLDHPDNGSITPNAQAEYPFSTDCGDYSLVALFGVGRRYDSTDQQFSLNYNIFYFIDADSAASAFEEMAALLACPAIGTPVEVTMPLGDEAFAIQKMAQDSAGSPVGANFVYVRLGNVVTIFALLAQSGNPADLDPQLTFNGATLLLGKIGRAPGVVQ